MTEPKRPTKLRFTESMPRPLMALFLMLVIAAIAVTLAILATSGSEVLALQDRRPPPRATFSHDAGKVTPAPLGATIPRVDPACDALRTTRLVASGNGVLRLRAALAHACTLARGAGPDVAAALRALAGGTLEFGIFRRTGVESTADFATRTIWLNAKFAIRTTPVEQLTPVVLHEAWHLGRPDVPITAAEELRARRVEVAACRFLVPLDDWPRWCTDARALTDLEPARAIALLRSAGYRDR